MNICEINGKQVWIADNMKEALQILSNCRGGKFAKVYGYVSTSNRIVPEVADITFLSRFSYHNLLKRKIEALKNLNFSDIVVKGDKLTGDCSEIFNDSKAKMIESMEKTLSGDRSDSHRKAHDTFYITTSEGIKIHLLTEKQGKETVLVLQDGLPIADSIMVSMIEMGRIVRSQGEYKIVNSGAKVQMDKCIEKALNKKSVSIKTLSFKNDNFEKLSMDGEKFTAENLCKTVFETVSIEDMKDIVDNVDA